MLVASCMIDMLVASCMIDMLVASCMMVTGIWWSPVV